VKLHVANDLKRLATSASAEVARIARESILRNGVFRIALSGGSTPRALYRSLVRAKVDWTRVEFFFSDERNVPPDDERSNFRLADEHLFQPLSIDPERIYPWHLEVGGPDAVGEEYSSRIRVAFVKNQGPADPGTYRDTAALDNEIRFDLVLLGMGADGHTASLFPKTMALQFTGEIAAANWVPQLHEWRFTFTFTTINNARNVMFLVSGDEKAPALSAVLEGDRQPELLPAQSVQPLDGELFFFVDSAAAAELTPKHLIS
jgi:6-phosphogluconolactonase